MVLQNVLTLRIIIRYNKDNETIRKYWRLLMSDAINAVHAEFLPLKHDLITRIKAPVNTALIKKNTFDKFGDGRYISVETVTDILNETFGFIWSWEIINYVDKNDYVVCHGRLTIPGIGIKDGVGSAKADKKDNSTMYSSATSFAFKNAAKKIGIASNLFNSEDWDQDVSVFEPGWVDQPESTATPLPAPTQKLVSQTEKVIPNNVKEKATELKAAYDIKTKAQFVALAAIWNPTITSFEQLDEANIEQLHTYVIANPEEFEDFKAEDHK
jgi:hypothetical protein